MKTVRDVIRNWALAAIIFVGGVISLSAQRAMTDQQLADEGLIASVTITGVEEGSNGCRVARYHFAAANGAIVEGRDGCLADDETGPTEVTYLATDPPTHRRGDLRGHHAWMDVTVMAGASVVASVALLLLALGVRFAWDRWSRRR